MCLSIVLPIRDSNEIGRQLLGELNGGEVLGIGVIYETFQSSGIAPVVKEDLNTMERGIEIELDVLISIIEVMLSGPGDVCESM